jgi:hypothetical chaperone protein
VVADIGGGTSDFSLLRLGPERARREDRTSDVLACAGVHVGGTDFDRQASLAHVMPYFGLGGRLKSGREMPNAIYFDLATWHTINRAYTRQAAATLKDLGSDIADQRGYARLLRLIERRDGHRLALDVEAAKIALSFSDHYALPLERYEPGLQCRFERQAFDAATGSLVARIGAAVDALLRDARVSADRVESIYLTGGGSAMPALRACIEAHLPAAKLTTGDTFGSIGAGLGVAAARRYGVVG